jgi:hypothetical protein
MERARLLQEDIKRKGNNLLASYKIFGIDEMVECLEHRN